MLKPIDTLKILNNQPAKKVNAGEVIFTEGETAEVMYAIEEGTVTMSITGKQIETLESGDVFGEGALLHSDHRRASTAIAETDCILLEVNREHFMFAVQQAPMFALEVLQSYSARFRRVKDRLQAFL